MKLEELLKHETARRESFKLLAECYYLPSPDLIHVLKELERRMRDICGEAVQYAFSMKEEFQRIKDLKFLRIDYARLFMGPYKLLAPPYGSVYLEGQRKLMGDSTADTRNRYREMGLDISKSFQEAPDHIAAELEFMYFLIFKEMEAIGKSDVSEAIEFLEKQESFLEVHLGAWVDEFAENIDENAQTKFYKNLGRCSKVFIRSDFKRLKKLLNSGPGRRRPCFLEAKDIRKISEEQFFNYGLNRK